MNWETFQNTLDQQIDYMVVNEGLPRIERDTLQSSFSSSDFDQNSLLIQLDASEETKLINAGKQIILLAIHQTLEDLCKRGFLSHIETAPTALDDRNFAYTLYITGVEDDDYRTVLTVHEGDFFILLTLYQPYM